MKTSKISNFGSRGQIIDDIDFATIDDDQWLEIGKSHLKNLLTIIRNPKNLTKDRFYHSIARFGPTKGSVRAHYARKYGRLIDAFDPASLEGVSPEDQEFLLSRTYQMEKTEEGNTLSRVYGMKDEQGHMLGAFDTGDINWHSNESSQLTFAPEVALMGSYKMIGSATGFVQTADYYESVSDSLRSELDDMILVHNYTPGAISPAELNNPLFSHQIRTNFCPVNGAETPLVITSPGGIKGLHYSISTADQIKGLSQQASKEIFAMIDRELFSDRYTFYHWYKHDNDLLLFDNSITMHCRVGGEPDRLAYRIQYEPCNLLDGPWYPYSQPEFNQEYVLRTHELVKILEIKNFKLPVLDNT